MKITLVPIAGLCNRINAITCGLLYQENNPNCNLNIKWWKTHDCCANFDDLFNPKFFPGKVERMNSLFKDRPGTPRNFFIPRKFRHFFYDLEINPSSNLNDFETNILNKKDVFIAVHNNFCNLLITKSLGDLFVPADDIQFRINQITETWNNDVIGLHIRRTDNIQAIKNSPLTHFIDIIEKEIGENINTKFYLATDDDSVKNKLKELYGNRIITLHLNLKRNSVQGMKDAVLDLYCLGKTSRIYGSSHSTYSKIASQLYDIPLIV